jgi:hypothetical protein
VMNARGYPMADFEQRAADVSVDHSSLVTSYRTLTKSVKPRTRRPRSRCVRRCCTIAASSRSCSVRRKPSPLASPNLCHTGAAALQRESRLFHVRLSPPRNHDHAS